MSAQGLALSLDEVTVQLVAIASDLDAEARRRSGLPERRISIRLKDRGGPICQGGYNTFFAAVSSPLEGDIEVAGIVNRDGSAVPWKLFAGTSPGVYPAPGGNGAAAVNYAMSAPADAGKVLIVFMPT